VPLEEEVAELTVGHRSTVVHVQPEEVLNNIVPLTSGFLMKDIDDKGVDVVDGEFSLLVLELGEVNLKTVPDMVT
jgi:hypothetical protein